MLGFDPLSSPPKGLYLSVGLSADQSFETIDRAGRIDLLIVAGGALATFAATAFLGWQAFLRPLQPLTDVLRRWRDARTGHMAGEGEIAQLGTTLDGLFDQLTRTQADRDLVSQEMAHRVKNTLATVQAIACRTMNKAAPANQLLPAFQSRIGALAHTHEIHFRERWEAADLVDIVRSVVSALCDDVDGRFRIAGPSVEPPAREALAMTLVIHELCTNALKCGALAIDGSIAVDWTLTPGSRGRTLTMSWRETNAGPTRAPSSIGKRFGTRLLAVAYGASALTRLRHEAEGVVCPIEIVLEDRTEGT